MPSLFHVKNAEIYEQLMGRFSALLVPQFLQWLNIAAADSILDVGCGTGSLLQELLHQKIAAHITALDYEPQFIAYCAETYAAQKNVMMMQADAELLPFECHRFDHTLSMLTVHFIKDPVQALKEMKRVTRPGGIIAATVWKAGGAMAQKLFWDTVSEIDAGAAEKADAMKKNPMTHSQGLEDAFTQAGLSHVKITELSISMDYKNFEEFWSPYAVSDSKTNKFMASLAPGNAEKLREHLRIRYLDGKADGPRSFPAIALAVKAIA